MEPQRTILIVDDAPMFRELGSVFLARTARVLTANNGFEALEVMRRDRPDVVVADLEMPCLAGDALCERIKADPEIGGIPVILVTSTERGEERARAVRAGADDVIAKPISRIVLIQAVNRFLRRAGPRALARVELEARVHIVGGIRGQDVWGTARNLSRGGLFVEADCEVEPPCEVSLELALPDAQDTLESTAQVMWRRKPGATPGFGLQFLALDRDSAERIEAYVYERTPAAAAAVPLQAVR